MTALLVLWLAFADLASVKAEPDFERRSEMALLNADHALDEARKAYTDGDDKVFQSALEEMASSVSVSSEALSQTHGQPRNSKYYKRAELKIRALMRRLTGFRAEVTFETQPAIDAAVKSLSEVHDQLLNAIMSKKK